MSRSRRKHAIISQTCGGHNKSEKQDKRRANRRLRRAVRSGKWYAMLREVSNVWTFLKDGKCDWTGTDYEKKARRK